MQAKLIKIIEDKGTVRQRLWLVTPKLEGHKYVITSEVKDKIAFETYIFPSDKNGNITDYGDLDGSMRGINCYKTALKKAGYEC